MMKKIHLLFFALLIVMFPACSDDDNDELSENTIEFDYIHKEDSYPYIGIAGEGLKINWGNGSTTTLTQSGNPIALNYSANDIGKTFKIRITGRTISGLELGVRYSPNHSDKRISGLKMGKVPGLRKLIIRQLAEQSVLDLRGCVNLISFDLYDCRELQSVNFATPSKIGELYVGTCQNLSLNMQELTGLRGAIRAGCFRQLLWQHRYTRSA